MQHLKPTQDHPIAISPSDERVMVRFHGHVIADTTDAVVLLEAKYPPVYYIPRDDVRMEKLERSVHKTHCPYKGEASYFTLKDGKHVAENAVWSYEAPYPDMEEIEGRLAFYPNKVDIEVS